MIKFSAIGARSSRRRGTTADSFCTSSARLLRALAAIAALTTTTGALATGFKCSPAFEESVLPVGFGGGDIAGADLDGDGDTDMVVTSEAESSFAVLLQEDDGTFTILPHQSLSHAPQNLHLADFNGDGAVDLVTSSELSEYLTTRLGNGDGTFGVQTHYFVGNSPRTPRTADLNGDGILDLLTACRHSDTVVTLMGIGGGTFGVPVSSGGSDKPMGLVVVDIDNDGDTDACTVNFHTGPGGSVRTYLNDGSGELTYEATFGIAALDPTAIDARDLNGDGWIDLVTSNFSSGSMSVLLNSGSGTFPTAVTYPSGVDPIDIVIKDVNADGLDDLVTVNGDFSVPGAESVRVRFNAGDGTFPDTALLYAGVRPQAALVTDLNGDGAIDIAVPNESTELSLFTSRCTPIVIHTGPQSQLIASGGAFVSFSVTASGADLLYQWRRDGLDLMDGGNVAGATTSTLTLFADLADEATYDCVLISGSDLLVTDPAVLAVRQACLADLDGDGQVGFADLTTILSAWGICLP